MNCFQMVTDFHIKNGQMYNSAYTGQISIQVRELRQRLILEELGELACAVHNHDMVQVADGLADLLYVIYGTAVSYGVPLGDLFINSLGYDFVPEFDNNFNGLTEISKHASDLFEVMLEEDPAMLSMNMKLLGLTLVVTTYAASLGIPLKAIFKEVHRSNMTKNLGGATDGKKYGTENAKGEKYSPPRIAEILSGQQLEPIDIES